MSDKKGKAKPTLISLSSSEEEDETEEEVGDDDDYEDRSFSGSSGDETEEAEEEENDSDDNDRTENDDSLCNGVITLLKEGDDLESLSLKQLKAYLRNHGLRITGTTAVCQQRILEHWRIKDGRAEALYPRSSFFINCTGDVCKGDVVLFTQKVYKKFNKMTRRGKLLGKRTIAGRVVKESYGKAKQQHTFTVEVLWSKGSKKLPPLFPLLVKGRNLYKLKTYRQHWSDEAERKHVLSEKHKRGNAARLVKAMKITRKWSTDVGTKRQKHSHQSRPLKKRKTTEPDRGKINNPRRKTPIPRCPSMGNNYQVSSPVGKVKKKQNSRFRVSNTSYSYEKPVHFAEDTGAFHHSYAGTILNPYQPQRNFNHRSAPHGFASYNIGSTSTMVRSLSFRPYVDPWTIPASQNQQFN
ncbi:hypothetical protein ERO13_A12G070100v2 [Gossypium hirsutum]|uniref:Zinc finger CCCH domain-containing protein 62 isoform X1 n=1 Tax=Gossypium hirsutum TaxID=3635 RepID=A0A1U8M6N4_GOSHI|nr:zinc finger CCCH domain-containing protein 62 isoform X1 [Gossypium hirsutum]KAG4169181.1 hypothetical protein ERO13_A12G070100v2 [Gossypium hirsutum]